jgi:hypothetical protein
MTLAIQLNPVRFVSRNKGADFAIHGPDDMELGAAWRKSGDYGDYLSVRLDCPEVESALKHSTDVLGHLVAHVLEPAGDRPLGDGLTELGHRDLCHRESRSFLDERGRSRGAQVGDERFVSARRRRCGLSR